MQDEIEVKERWLELCEQASTEQNPRKLITLVGQITGLLDAKQKRPMSNDIHDENKKMLRRRSA